LNSNIKLGAGITAAGSIRDIFAGRKSEILLEQLAMKTTNPGDNQRFELLSKT
jgi:hypothetical protein